MSYCANEETESYTGRVIRETDEAVLVDFGLGEEKEGVWIPKSQIKYREETSGSLTTFVLPVWLAVDRGLE